MEQLVLLSLHGVSRHAPPKVGNWLRSNRFERHLWQGQPMTVEEFGRVANRAIDDAMDMVGCRVRIEVIEGVRSAEEQPPPAVDDLTNPPKAEARRGKTPRPTPAVKVTLEDIDAELV